MFIGDNGWSWYFIKPATIAVEKQSTNNMNVILQLCLVQLTKNSSIHEFLKPCIHFLQQDIFSPVSLVTYTTGIRNNRACFCHSTNFHCDVTRIPPSFSRLQTSATVAKINILAESLTNKWMVWLNLAL